MSYRVPIYFLWSFVTWVRSQQRQDMCQPQFTVVSLELKRAFLLFFLSSLEMNHIMRKRDNGCKTNNPVNHLKCAKS